MICTLERVYREALPVSARAGGQDEAINRAFKLLERVIELEKRIGYLKQPDPAEQPNQNGYHNEPVAGTNEVVRYKRKGEGFVVVELLRMDEEDGFVWADEPFFLPKDFKFVKSLPNGASLYTWDNIRYLSGTAGEAMVQDGKVIKFKMTAIS